MAIQVVKTSVSELREVRKGIVREAVVRLVQDTTHSEEGIDELVANPQVGQAILSWRGIVRDCEGEVDAIAGKLFTPQQRESLRETADKIFAKGDGGTPKMGDHEAVKVCERLLLQKGIQHRNMKNPHLGEKDPHAAARFIESVKGGIPKLKSPKLAATPQTTDWFFELLAKLGG